MPNCFGQQNYRIHTVAFYNFENLFDTMIQLLMMMNGHQKRKALDIQKVPPKLENLSRVLLEIDLQKTPFTHFIACSEIENRGVLEDLIKQPKLILKTTVSSILILQINVVSMWLAVPAQIFSSYLIH
jgi:hypothetical protein